MHRSRAFLAPLALGLFAAACADDAPIAPADLRSRTASLNVTAEVEGLEAPWGIYFKPGSADAVKAQVEASGGTVQVINDRFGFAMVSGLDDASAATVRGVRGVEEVALDELVDMGVEANGSDLDLADETASPTAPATAFFFPRQWHLQAIEAQAAWNAGKLGSSDVTVAVVDGGVGYTHPDLAGLVDLSRSASFLPIEDGFLQTVFPGAHPVADLQYHGTHVAATIASNAGAAAGVTSRTTIMGVKVCYGVTLSSGGVIITRAGSCSGTAIVAGIAHAVENGADVINMSLGGAFLKRGSKGFHSTINRLFNYANQQGVVIVVAAGNNGSDLDRHQLPDAAGNPITYPSLFKTYCDAPNVVCVSATGPTAGALNGPWTNIDALAPYSNYGRSVITVAGPGGNFRPVWAACSQFSLAIPACRTGTFIVGISGTSMATPHVSGLAALLFADGVTQPSQVRARLTQGADDLGEPGTDPAYGRGRINVRKTLGL
jgi:subtilisin family serine protease